MSLAEEREILRMRLLEERRAGWNEAIEAIRKKIVANSKSRGFMAASIGDLASLKSRR